VHRRIAALLVVAATAACGNAGDDAPRSVAFDAYLTELAPMAWRSSGADSWEVWVCDIPVGALPSLYADTPRVPLDPAVLAASFGEVADYFATVSGGAYRPTFRAGGETLLPVDAEPAECIDAALDGSGADAQGVLVVATAEHLATAEGGWTNPGEGCEQPCPASVSRRNVYLGAADFRSEWGDQTPLDLVEHELGHALGWWHSAYDSGGTTPYRSAIDVMSNSAAPRDVDASLRHGPNPLAVHRLRCGWIGFQIDTSADVRTSPLVVPVDDARFLVVEYVANDGFNAHLARSGVAIHRVDVTARTIEPVHTTTEPFDDLLQRGDRVVVNDRTIMVDDTWMVTVD
jgi:hypothetical protein